MKNSETTKKVLGFMYFVYLVKCQDIEYSKIQRCLSFGVLPLFTHDISLILGIGLRDRLLGLNLVVIVLGLGRMSFFITFGGCFHFIKLLFHALESHLGGIVLDAKVFGNGWNVNLRVNMVSIIHEIQVKSVEQNTT